MASTDKKIRMTVVLNNLDYHAFHQKVEGMYANHTKIVRELIRMWVTGECSCIGKKRRHA